MKDETIRKGTSSRLLKAAMKESGTRQTDLAEALGMTQASISGRINREQIGLSTFVTMMNAMGYKVFVGKGDEADADKMWEVEATYVD